MFNASDTPALQLNRHPGMRRIDVQRIRHTCATTEPSSGYQESRDKVNLDSAPQPKSSFFLSQFETRDDTSSEEFRLKLASQVKLFINSA